MSTIGQQECVGGRTNGGTGSGVNRVRATIRRASGLDHPDAVTVRLISDCIRDRVCYSNWLIVVLY